MYENIHKEICSAMGIGTKDPETKTVEKKSSEKKSKGK